MSLIPNIIFIALFSFALSLFIKNVKKIYRNINLGISVDRTDNKKTRLIQMLRIAFGQSKMIDKPIVGLLHIVVYVGFLVINIELLEIIVDGALGTHRVFAPFLGSFYDFLIAFFEIFAFLVIVSVVIFWIRRNMLNIKRFLSLEMKGWPKNDANIILYVEVVLMVLFLTMNGADLWIQQNSPELNYISAGSFPISQYLLPLFDGLSSNVVFIIERSAWWLHIIGILCFLNYLYYSKHLHILLAFPNTYFANLNAKGKFSNLKSVTNEVKMMLDPSIDPYSNASPVEVSKFGASDVFDLSKIQLLNAYTCTECGRCTSECPANQTGKKLSPRKIMMDTRDRVEAVGRNIDTNKGEFKPDGKELLSDYISKEELWACTSCNACVEACPIGIDPLSIIMDMRRYLVMEKSDAPSELNNMMSNIENNGAPWPFNQMDKLNWKNEI
ncbi:(Fe-S)-binding protein [Flavobacteriaceae bacterium]|nr:(Fe-S)-binding protein [Flavobacteriaceae bacterium]MDA9239488.1 (Fe-S)-binding protein [bacterium]MDA9213349.1 (Fe-S)-binding protein [Flavobacteriaceae bacterium]MDA9827483.1 (Fe-S)-binding protein [Flavobacteriaceae bacterium]MDB0041080.1 (Fe-S)-binding protein [bacterium]